MPSNNRIYLDNAATSWPKPDAVYAAVDHYMRANGAPAGRGAYGEASDVERQVIDTRKKVASLVGESDPSRIVFTCNGTDSLNLAIHGLLRPGDHVVTSCLEHNSVLRPLRFLEESLGLEVSRIPCGASGIIDPQEFAAAIRSNTKLLILTHASNVTGAIQPAAAVGAIAKQHGIRFLVDAAQSIGHIQVNANELGADLIAAPGHKGMFGPLGTGVLFVAAGVEEFIASIRQGGTGTMSENDRQPRTLPDKYESGNHNVPGIVGLNAGVAYLFDRGLDEIQKHERCLTERLLEGLAQVDGVALHGPCDAKCQLGVVSLTIDGYDPQEVATMLDSAYMIQVRSGLHCAPLAHAALGTDKAGGTIRFSIGAFNNLKQIEQAVEAIGEIAASVVL